MYLLIFLVYVQHLDGKKHPLEADEEIPADVKMVVIVPSNLGSLVHKIQH